MTTSAPAAAVRLDRVKVVPTRTTPKGQTPTPAASSVAPAAAAATSPSAPKPTHRKTAGPPMPVTATIAAPASPNAHKPATANGGRIVLSGTGARTITNCVPKKKKKKDSSRRLRSRRVGRAFVVSDVPMLDSPDWSSDDEVDNPKFNREFRQKHNEQLRKLLKENEELERKAAASKASDEKQEAQSKKRARPSPSPKALPSPKVAEKRVETKAETSPRKNTGKKGEEVEKEGTNVRDSLSLHRPLKNAATTSDGAVETTPRASAPVSSNAVAGTSSGSISGLYDTGRDSFRSTGSGVVLSRASDASLSYNSGSDAGSWGAAGSFNDAFFYGDYGSSATLATTSGSAGHISRGHSRTSSRSSNTSPLPPLDEEEYEAARGATGAAATAAADTNTSLHATFAPHTVSPSETRPPGPASKDRAVAVENSPPQAIFADDLLPLPSDETAGPTATRGPGSVPPTSGANGAPQSILSNPRNERRAGADGTFTTTGAPKHAGHARISNGGAESDAATNGVEMVRFSRPLSKRASQREVPDEVKNVLLLSISSRSNNEGEYNLNFDEVETESSPQRGTELDDFLFSRRRSSKLSVGFQPTHDNPTQQQQHGAADIARNSHSMGVSTGSDSPIPDGSYVFLGGLYPLPPHSGQDGDGDGEDGVEFWDLFGIGSAHGNNMHGNANGAPRSLLANAAPVSRRDSMHLLQSTRKNVSYFGSINPTSYHTARALSMRRDSAMSMRRDSHMMKAGYSNVGGNNHDMLRMYSLVRGGRRTNNTATVAITEPVEGMSVDSRPYAAAVAKPVGLGASRTASFSTDNPSLHVSLLSDSGSGSRSYELPQPMLQDNSSSPMTNKFGEKGATDTTPEKAPLPKKSAQTTTTSTAATTSTATDREAVSRQSPSTNQRPPPAPASPSLQQKQPPEPMKQLSRARRPGDGSLETATARSPASCMKDVPGFAAPATTATTVSAFIPSHVARRSSAMTIERGFHTFGSESERRHSVPTMGSGNEFTQYSFSGLDETRSMQRDGIFPGVFTNTKAWEDS